MMGKVIGFNMLGLLKWQGLADSSKRGKVRSGCASAHDDLFRADWICRLHAAVPVLM